MNDRRLNARYLILLPCLLLFAAYAYAGIYEWTDAQGTVHFSDTPQAHASRVESDPTVAGHGANHSPGDQSSPPPQKRTAVQQQKVVMYSTSWCPYCKQARAFFRENGIQFTDYDIEKDPVAALQYRQLHGRGVPLILVGNTRINGFSVQSFEQAYNSAKW